MHVKIKLETSNFQYLLEVAQIDDLRVKKSREHREGGFLETSFFNRFTWNIDRYIERDRRF